MTMQAPSERVRLRCRPERGSYDPDAIAAILDEAYVGHLGLVLEGQPVVIPHAHWRIGDEVLIHTAAAGRVARALTEGAECCLCVSLLDGLVLARSAYHHSMNYRSVMVFGRPRLLVDPAEKAAALTALVEKMRAGRSREARPPNGAELKATAVLALPLNEASAKMRSGGPKDAAADMTLPVWSGIVPLALTAGEPVEG